jgi:hypothetical protein
VLVAIIGCDSGTVWKDGEYQVAWIDTHDTMSLYRGNANRVSSIVVGVGSDTNYVVARQQNRPGALDSMYFVIDKRLDSEVGGGTIGPLSIEEFERMTLALRLPELHDL